MTPDTGFPANINRSDVQVIFDDPECSLYLLQRLIRAYRLLHTKSRRGGINFRLNKIASIQTRFLCYSRILSFYPKLVNIFFSQRDKRSLRLPDRAEMFPRFARTLVAGCFFYYGMIERIEDRYCLLPWFFLNVPCYCPTPITLY